MSDFTALAEERIGITLCGKYRLESVLGVGGMAAVYRGTHRNGNRVAVKVLHPHLGLNADIRTRFLREGYVANKVEHRGAVRVLDDDIEKDGSVFLVMELLEGETLEARWARTGRKLPIREVCELTHQLVDVLAAAHEVGIVHRDIKPENLFLTRDGVLKVLDFGIARLQDPATAQAATRTGRMLGTPAYMAPEQALGKSRAVDGQTDVWSAGATMFTLASGELVHDAETVEELIVFAGSRHARSLAEVAPNLSPSIVAVVDRALYFDKAKRWPSARAMETALEAAYLETFRSAIPGARSRASFSDTAFGATAHEDRRRTAPPVRVASTVDSTHYAAPMAGLAMPTVDSTEITTDPMFAHDPTRMRGASTTAGVDASGQERSVPTPARRTAWLPWAAAGALLLVVGSVSGVVAMRGDVKAPASASSTPNVVGSAVPAPSSTSSTTAVPVAAKPISDAGPDVATTQLPAAPTHSATTLPGFGPRPRVPPPAQSTAAPVPVPTPTPANCDPPYTIGEGGHHVLKPGCN